MKTRAAVALEKAKHVCPSDGRLAARSEETAVLDEDADGGREDEAGEHADQQRSR